MKTEDLKAQGFTDEQISFIMAENGKDIKREKDKADSYKSQLDTATQTLKGFEGVNVEEMKNKISQLTADLENSQKKHAEEMAQRDFNDLLNSYATEYKARNIKAVMPFLDVEALRQSKNQKDDLKTAFETVRKENGYLFEDERIPRVVSFTSGIDTNTGSTTSKANEALRSFFGKE